MRSTIVIILLLFLISCDNSLDPLDREKGIYAVSGVLDLNKTENYIRVKDLNAPFTLEATDSLGAVVTFENLESGDRTVLESNRVEEDGVYLHNFRVDEKILPDTPYRLSVEGSDGEDVVIDALTPTNSEPEIHPLNENCYTPINFDINPSNGGTIAVRFGLRIPNRARVDTVWQDPIVLTPEVLDGEERISLTFLPNDRIQLVVGPSGFPRLRCVHLNEPAVFISYAHYGRGFYEKVAPNEFDIFGSTDRFGAFYRDTVRVPIDTSRVCPQDC